MGFYKARPSYPVHHGNAVIYDRTIQTNGFAVDATPYERISSWYQNRFSLIRTQHKFPTSVAELLTAVESGSAGDIVHVPAGTFVLTEVMTIPDGVTIIGRGEGVTTIKGQVNSVGGPIGIRIYSLTFDITGVSTGVLLENGIYFLEDITVQGPALAESNSLTIGATTSPAWGVLTRVTSLDSSRDCIAFTAGSTVLGGKSFGMLIDCVAVNPGPLGTHNGLTCHSGFCITDYFGLYSGTNQAVMVNPDAAISQITLIGTTVLGYARFWKAIGAYIKTTSLASPVAELLGDNASVVRTRIIGDASTTNALTINCLNPWIESCRIEGASTGVGIGGSSLTYGNIYMLNLDLYNNKYGYNHPNVSNVTKLYMYNCTEHSATGVNSVTTGAFASMDADYNTFQTGVYAPNYISGSNDALTTIPEYTGLYPTIGGNIDRAGNPRLVFQDSLDLLGNPRSFAGLISRGPVERPTI